MVRPVAARCAIPSGDAMKHVLTVRIFAAVVLASAAFAASPQTPASQVSAGASVQDQAVTDADANRIAETKPWVDRHCARDTGSRIAPRDKDGKRCNTFGRVYTQDDIQRTGAVDLGEALRKLDPAIR